TALTDHGTQIEAAFPGTTARFDWLAGCDGLGSKVRSVILPDAAAAKFTGLIGTGGVAPMNDIKETHGTMKMVFGHSAFFGWIKPGSGPVHWFNSFAAPGPDSTPKHLAQHLRQLHARDPAEVRAILAQVQDPLQSYPIFDMPRLPHWHRGRVVLLGDAAHAVGPHAGQGASLAIMDAFALSQAFASASDPATAFAQFQASSAPFVTKVVGITARNASNKRQTTAFSRLIRRMMLPLVLPYGLKASRALLAAAPRY
ncbi:MAG: FAD-dependent monooxygenase, partial [bacterium]